MQIDEPWQRGPDHARLCAAALGRFPMLKQVTFTAQDAACGMAPMVLEGLAEADALSVELDSDWKAILLSERLEANRKLQRLSLSRCSLSPMGSTILGLVVANSLPALRVLEGMGPELRVPFAEAGAGVEEAASEDVSEEGYHAVAQVRDSVKMGKYIRKVAKSIGLE
eukprot:2306047-Rhodomonas_salina.3